MLQIEMFTDGQLMPSEGNSSLDPLGELKRKNIEDIQGDENTKGRKPEEEKEGNEQTTGISLKTLRMQHCRAKLNF
jgi:hypothetical protein